MLVTAMVNVNNCRERSANGKAKNFLNGGHSASATVTMYSKFVIVCCLLSENGIPVQQVPLVGCVCSSNYCCTFIVWLILQAVTGLQPLWPPPSQSDASAAQLILHYSLIVIWADGLSHCMTLKILCMQ
jgi:hypothetical protein